MQSPSQEIHAVVELANSSVTPDIQKAAINKFYTSDAGFHSPWYVVHPGPLSRESILGIYQWYRVISPSLEVEIRNIGPPSLARRASTPTNALQAFDRLRNIVYVDSAVLYHMRYSPFAPAPCRITSRFTLRHELGLYYIAMQEDFLHPDDIASIYVPHLGPVIRIALSGSALASNIWARCAQVLGIWRAHPGVDHIHVEEEVTKPCQARNGGDRISHDKVKKEGESSKNGINWQN